MLLALSKRVNLLVISLIVIGGILPLIWYSVSLGYLPTINPKNAIVLLNLPESRAGLIDVRSTDLYERQHIVGAQSWPLEQIQAMRSSNEIPVSWKGKTLFIICTAGFSSAQAIHHLQGIGIEEDIYNIRGGMQEYIAALRGYDPAQAAAFTTITGAPASRHMSPFEQWSAISAGFIFKPTYMILSLLLGIALWKTHKSELVVLMYSMFAFFIGEAWCAANYLFFSDTSYLAEFLHSYGMVVAFGLAIYAISDGLDVHVIKLSAQGQRCSALGLCRRCIKNEEVDCGARKILLLMIPAICVLAFIPLLAPINTVSYNTQILSTPYNYTHLVIYQLFESRYCPISALILLTSAFLVLWRQPRQPISICVRIFISAGVGALGFSFLRLLFGQVYANNLLWSTFWEELSELLFLIAAWGMLLIFRHSLLTDVTGFWPWRLLKRYLDPPPSQTTPV